ncbi:MAG: cyclase family protein [Firmicutes bacterium]|nr:cyclase family protein [Bacillota bacterium]
MWYDLTVAIAENMPRIPFLPPVGVEKVRDRAKGDPLEVRALHLATHIGTHLDAPSHRILGGTAIDAVPLEQTTGPAVVVKVAARPGEGFGPEVLEGLAEPVQPGDIVLFDTGFARYWETPTYHDNPYLTPELAELLVARGVKMVGIDAITVDMPTHRRPPDFDYPIHQILLGNNVLILENLTNLAPLAGRRVKLYAFPLKIAGGDAGLVRVVAEV